MSVVVRSARRPGSLALAALALALVSTSAGAVADGTPLGPVVTHTVFGAAVGVGNTLMEHDGQTNFAMRAGGSEASIPLSRMAPDATVVRAFLFWAGTFDPGDGIPLDRNVDFTLPNGTLFNDLSVDTLTPGEPAPSPSTLNRCVQRNHNIGGQIQPMYVCRREVTFLLQQLGAGGAVGIYGVDDVDLEPGDCFGEPGLCQSAFGGWAIVVMWESVTEPVRRDLVLFDAFFALDEQGSQFGGFSAGISPVFNVDGFTIGPTADGELTFMGFEGDAQLGVPPQNINGNPIQCFDGQCRDFIRIRTNGNPVFRDLSDVTNRAGNLLNGSNNLGGGLHPGLDIDTFDIGPSGLNVLRAGDTQLQLQAGSGDGVADDGSGGSGELFLLSFTLLSVETFSPRFLNNGTEKVVLEPVAGAGETLNYILRLENDGSAPANNTVVRDQLPAGVTYVPGSTTNTCGVASGDVGGTSPVLTPAGLNVATLSIGERCEVRFRVTVNGDVVDGTVLENFFTVAADALPPILVGPATTVIQAAEIGQPTKSVAVLGGGTPTQGASLVYTIRVPNTGSRAAPLVRVLDTIPGELEALQILSFPAGATNNTAGSTVDISNITIAAGSQAEVTFTARIRSDVVTGTVIANQGSVEQPSLPAALLTDDPSTAAAADPTRITVASGVSLAGSSKSVVDLDAATDGGRIEPGDVLEFTVTAVKNGPSATAVSLDDDLPANVGNCVALPGPAGGFTSCQPGGANGTGRVVGGVAFGPSPPTRTALFRFRVTVNATAPDGAVIQNTARLEPDIDPAQAVNVSSPALTVFARPEFVTSTKTVTDANGGQVRPNDLLQYAITVRNSGSIPAANVVVTDTVPAGLVSVVAQDGGTLAAGTITWNIASLAVGASAVVRFEARVAAGTVDGTSISNTARITANAPAQPFTTPPATVIVRSSPVLASTKTVADLTGGAPFRPGDVVRYTIALNNSGDGAATNVIVRDTIDPAFETVILTSGGRVEGGDVVFDSATTAALSSLAPGASVTLSFDARLLAVLPNGTVVSNQSRTTATQVATPELSDDPATAAADDPTRFTVTSQARLAMTKTFVDDNGGATLPGDTVTFTLSVSNVGDAPANGVAVTDPLDARLTFVSSVDGGTFAGGTVSFPTFNLLPGPPRALRFVARIAAPLANGTAIPNQASATAPGAVGTVSDNPATAAPNDPTIIVVTSRPVFDTTTKAVLDVDGDGVFEPLDAVRYTIVVENTGSENAVNVVVSDALPGAALENFVLGQGGVLAGNNATWSVGALAVGARATLTVDARIRRPIADALVVSNQAFVSATGVAATPSDDPVTAAVLDDPTRFTTTSKPRLTIDKTVVDVNGGTVVPGDVLEYTIHIESDGGRNADNVSVNDRVDNRLINVVPLDGGTLGPPGQTITWTFASIAIDTFRDVRFRATVRTPLPNGSNIDNQAFGNLAEPGVPGAPFPSDDPATAAPLDPTRVQVVSAADLAASTMETTDLAGAVIATANPGAQLRYAISVQNRGTDDANNTRVRVPLPAQVTFVSAPGGTLGPGGAVNFNQTGVPELASVSPGEIVNLVITVQLATPLDDGTLVSTQAELREGGPGGVFFSDDPSTAQFGDPTVLEIESAPVLANLEKRVVDENGGAFEPNDVVRYELTGGNTGNAIARNATWTDALPAQLELVDAGGGAVSGQTVTFALGDLAPGPNVTRVIRARVRATVTGGTVVSNQASASATGLAPVLSDDPTTAAPDDPTRFTVETVARLRVEKDATLGPGAGGPRVRSVAPGDIVRYTFTLTSFGTGPTLPSTLSDTLSSSLVNVVPGAGLAFNASTSTLTGNIASLAPGASVTLSFEAQVSNGATNGTSISNHATVSDGGAPPSGIGSVVSDDPATAAAGDATVLVVDATPVLTASGKVATDVDGGALLPGDVVRWVITIRNTGNGAAADVRVTDVVDARLAIGSVENGGAAAGNTIVWDATTTPALAAVPRGGSVELAFVSTVDDTVVSGTRIENQGRIVSRDVTGTVLTDDPGTAPPGDATAIVVVAPVLSATKRIVDLEGGGTLEPGDDIEYRITITNSGDVAASNVVVTDVLPVEGIGETALLDGGILSDGVAVWNVPSLAPGASTTVRIRAEIDALAVGGTVITNAAEVTADEVGLAVRSDDPDTAAVGDDTVRVVTAAETFAGSVELSDGETGAPLDPNGFVVPGQRVRARITFRNEGTQVAQAVVLRVPYEVLRFVPDETTGGGLIDATEVRWDASQNADFLQLARNEEISVEVEGAIASPIPDAVEIRVAGLVTSATSPAPTTLGPAIMRVRSRPDLSATTKEVSDEDGGQVEPGDVITYRITVINGGGNAASDVVVFDGIPGGTEYVFGSTRLRGAAVADDDEEFAPTLDGLEIGDLDAGRSAVVEFSVRVNANAPRGLRIDNQARLACVQPGTGAAVPDAVSDNPSTPLIIGDPTPVIVGGGASLVAQKVAAPSPARQGEQLTFAIHVENAGNEPAEDVAVSDILPAGVTYVAGTLTVDGALATDGADRDDAEIVGAGGPGSELRFRRDSLEAGEGVTFTFTVVVVADASISNQATVTSSEGTFLTDGDPSVSGAQPTVVPVSGARALLFDEDTLALSDDDGGALEPGDDVTIRATLRNRSLEAARITTLEFQASAQLEVIPAELDERFVFDGATRRITLAPKTAIEVEAGGAVDIAFFAIASTQASVGDPVRMVGSAEATSIDGALRVPIDLGRDQLTVGLLPGTAALEGTLFLEGGARDGAFDPDVDVRAKGITVLAFWRDDVDPVMTAISDENGRYRLLPIPSGRYRLELRSPGGAFFGEVAEGALDDGEVRERDVAVDVTGAVYVSGSQRAAEGSRVRLFVDDGDRDPGNDALVDPALLGDGQQGQPVSSQGLYRFDVTQPGRYRIEVDTPDPLTAFPSSTLPVTPDAGANPSGALFTPEAFGGGDGDVVDIALPINRPPGAAPLRPEDQRYFLRFEVDSDVSVPRMQRNFIPVDALRAQLAVTKTASRKRASVGDIVGYTVRVDNRAASGVTLAEGGVEIVDALPDGLKLVAQSYRLDRIDRDERGQEKRTHIEVGDGGGRVRTFGPFEMRGKAAYELRYNVVVTPGARFGVQENRAALRMAAGQIPLTENALASIQIVPDGTFDLGTIRAKVFCDDDGDGWQDPGEVGLPGTRMYVDTGQWADADVEGKAHFSALPAGMHVVKIDARTLPPGTSLLSTWSAGNGGERRTLYLSPGLPGQVSFGAQCAFVKAPPDEIIVNEAAYKPAEKPKHRVKLEGQATPPRVLVGVDGGEARELPLARVDLGLGIEGQEPAFAGAPGPNMPALVESALRPRLTFVPRVDGPAPASWMIAIEAMPQARPIWMLSGTGAPPPKIEWDGRDPSTGTGVVFEGELYRATLTVGFDGGDIAKSARREFGVRHGVAAGAPEQATAAEIDSDGGELFTKPAKPTTKLTKWLKEQAGALKGKKLVVVVHSDPAPGALQAQTAERAAAVKKALVKEGLTASDIEVRGAGDAFPRVPNLRKKDRAKNRRVELLVEKPAEVLPPLPAPSASPQLVKAGGKQIASDAPFNYEVDVTEGDALQLEITTSTGARLKIIDVLRESAAKAEGAPTAVQWNPGERVVVVGAAPPTAPAAADGGADAAAASTGSGGGSAGQRIDASLLDTRVTGARSELTKDPSGDVESTVFTTSVPAGIDVAEWTLRVMAEGADDGAGRTLREIHGDGRAPAEVKWDRVDVDGKRVDAKTKVFARLIVKTGAGDVGISPDFVADPAATAPAPTAAATAPAAPAVAASGPGVAEPARRIADPTVNGGKLKPEAETELKAIAADAVARGATAVRIEVHTDDVGSPVERRARTQRAADAMKAVMAKAGIDKKLIKAIGAGADSPLVPNVGLKMRAQNRRAEIILEVPAAAAPVAPTPTPSTEREPEIAAGTTKSGAEAGMPAALRANGAVIEVKDGVFVGEAPAMTTGEIVLDLRDAAGARASLRVRPGSGAVLQGPPPADYVPDVDVAVEGTQPSPSESGITAGGLMTPSELADAGVSGELVAVPELSDAADAGPGHPEWWPDESKLGARDLEVQLPAQLSSLQHDRLFVRGRTAPTNKLRIGAEQVAVDPITGRFAHSMKLGEGDGDVVVEVTDTQGNVGRVKRQVAVDTSGWFALALADTAFGGDGADLGERTPFTSVTLGDTFLYGRGAAFVKGKWRGPYLFQDYDLTLHVDTRRWQDDIFAPELIDPERFFPIYGDSSVENTDATRSGFPIYLDLRADTSSLVIGNVRTDIAGADLFRYQRARSGAQLTFDRGWTGALDIAPPPATGERKPALSPENDPWRTRVTTFVAGGGGQRHARAELLGTGSSVYFLRHERVVEGSERVAIIVRDGVTGTEVSRTTKVRDVDYNIRYLEGRVMFKEPVGAFTDASGGFDSNQNLGQVVSGNRVFVEVEYEHQDDDPFMGVGAGAHVRQTIMGHAEVGGGYIYEAREGGLLGYQLGGGHARLYLDEGTWLQAEVLGSQSVDAGNFVSFDGGLTYQSLGQGLDTKDARIGATTYPAQREGAAFKLDGQAQLGRYIGLKSHADLQLHGYVQQLQPGFFAGASIVEQGQTKWGVDGAWQIYEPGKLKLRYDGVISEIPEFAPVTEFRTLQRQIATLRYEHRVVAPVLLSGEYGYGFTADRGSFNRSDIAPPAPVHTNVVALGVDWQLLESLAIALKQEAVLSGDPNQLRGPLDQLITHLTLRYALNDTLSIIGGTSARWSGENQAHAGLSVAVNEKSRVYLTERVGLLPAPVTGTMGFRTSTIVGGESELAEGSKAYAEYQLDGGLSGEQSRGVIGTKTMWKLPWGFALQFGYERIVLVGGIVPVTESGNIPPGAFTDGTFYAAPGANGGGSFVAGEGSRDALSAGVEYKRGESVIASQRFELRYDNQTEARGGRDRLWFLSGSAGSVRLSPELSLLARYNIALAQDLALAAREAYFEEGAFGVAYRPVTHDWVSVLAKLSRRVDVRPLSLENGTTDDYTAHAMSIEPIVELPWQLQISEKLALKHASQKLDDTPEANALTGLWITRVQLHTMGLLRSVGAFGAEGAPIPGEIDLGLEYRVLAGFTYGSVEHGPLIELQLAPIEYFRIGVGYNWTRFSDDELARGDIDRSGFFVRAVGTF